MLYDRSCGSLGVFARRLYQEEGSGGVYLVRLVLWGVDALLQSLYAEADGRCIDILKLSVGTWVSEIRELEWFGLQSAAFCLETRSEKGDGENRQVPTLNVLQWSLDAFLGQNRV